MHIRPLRLSILISALLALAASGFAQQIRTAPDFFARVASTYEEVQDYIAQLVVSDSETESRGTLYYRRPGSIRIDYSEPEGQIIVSDGTLLRAYIPTENVVLEQQLNSEQQADPAQLASAEGLTLLQENYNIAYLDSPNPQALDESDSTPVVKLRLTWRTPDEQFRELVISVDDDFLIRRIEGITVDYNRITFDFINTRVNQSIPDSRFEFDAPSTANVYDNFLFDPTN